MKKVYFISGLGADKRVFSFLDLSFCEPVFLEWIAPLKNESLESYAHRLLATIPDKHPTIVGVSFGGMLATEMAKTDPAIKSVIIASNKSATEFPKYLRASKYFPVYKWLPNPLLKRSAYAFKWVLGRNEKVQKQIILDIIRETDMDFVKWAVDAILHWNNTEVPKNLTHIHGTGDKLLPYKLVKADYTIPDGRHVLPLDHHKEISDLLRKLV
ncbi:MAG: alpha/beta hydrolase [Chitinophagaceae bacterium]|nr:alpha/beta hydrolase [Chitinophagaceae bacterium]